MPICWLLPNAKKIHEKRKHLVVLAFLRGLSTNFDTVRLQTLGGVHLPYLANAFSCILRVSLESSRDWSRLHLLVRIDLYLSFKVVVAIVVVEVMVVVEANEVVIMEVVMVIETEDIVIVEVLVARRSWMFITMGRKGMFKGTVRNCIIYHTICFCSSQKIVD